MKKALFFFALGPFLCPAQEYAILETEKVSIDKKFTRSLSARGQDLTAFKIEGTFYSTDLMSTSTVPAKINLIQPTAIDLGIKAEDLISDLLKDGFERLMKENPALRNKQLYDEYRTNNNVHLILDTVRIIPQQVEGQIAYVVELRFLWQSQDRFGVLRSIVGVTAASYELIDGNLWSGIDAVDYAEKGDLSTIKEFYRTLLRYNNDWTLYTPSDSDAKVISVGNATFGGIIKKYRSLAPISCQEYENAVLELLEEIKEPLGKGKDVEQYIATIGFAENTGKSQSVIEDCATIWKDDHAARKNFLNANWDDLMDEVLALSAFLSDYQPPDQVDAFCPYIDQVIQDVKVKRNLDLPTIKDIDGIADEYHSDLCGQINDKYNDKYSFESAQEQRDYIPTQWKSFLTRLHTSLNEYQPISLSQFTSEQQP